jgi:hypothetical protein
MYRTGELMLMLLYLLVTSPVWVPARILGHVWFLARTNFKDANKPVL